LAEIDALLADAPRFEVRAARLFVDFERRLSRGTGLMRTSGR
jgi:hypothetical protein